jgi:hypothetical protein
MVSLRSLLLRRKRPVTQRKVLTVKKILAVISVVIASVVCSTAQNAHSQNDFVIDENRPYVYLVFDHMGKGPRFTEDEPATRIWFKLVNNCRVPIRVRTFGAPKSDSDAVRSFGTPNLGSEVGVLHDVVRDTEMLVITSDLDPRPTEKKLSKMPIGYVAELSSVATIAPSASLLFSVPTNHLGENWHMEIPFNFEVPRKCCRPENIGGEPKMVLLYSISDLPDNIKHQVRAQR